MPHSPADDLLVAAVQGDEQAFTELYRLVQPSLLRYVRVMAPQHADDVASETWAAVVPRLAAFEGDERAFRSWLFTIARSKVIDRARYDARRPVRTAADLEALARPDPQDVAAEAMESLSTQSALRLIATLPSDQAEIVTLRVIGQLDAAEVGAIVGKSAGAVRVAQHRALKRLAELLSPPRSTSPDDGVTRGDDTTFRST